MKRQRTFVAPQAQRGSAAIELAGIAPVMLFIVFAMLQFGRIFWQYNAVQKGAHDAARFLALVPATEMANWTAALATRAMAQQMVVDAVAGVQLPAIDPGVVAVEFRCGVNSDVVCTYSNAASGQVTKVTVKLDTLLTDDSFYLFDDSWSYVNGIGIRSETVMHRTN